MVHLHVNLSCGAQMFFPAKWVFLVFFQKKKFEKWVAHFRSYVYQLSTMLYFTARNLGMRFKLRLYHSTQYRRDAVFHVFGTKKKEKKTNAKISMKTYFLTVENTVVLCKNLDTEGKIHFVVALAVSLATREGSDSW